MKLLSKASCDIEQLRDRVSKGFKYIEIQLTKEFFANSNITNYMHILSKDWDILHVHMPFIPGQGDLPIEFIGKAEYANIFLNAIRLSQECAKFYGHKVVAILHTELPLSVMQKLPHSLDKVKEIFSLALQYAPDVEFSIENGALYSIRRDRIRINPSAFDENVQWAEYLNKEFNTNKFKTTVDICHLLMTKKMTDVFLQDPKTADMKKTIAWYFQQNQHSINNIHLNNIHSLGVRGDHSETFELSNIYDVLTLDTIFELYKKYCNECDITIEVDEQNYNDAKKAAALRDLICERYEYVEY